MLEEKVGDIWSYAKTHRVVVPTNQLGVMGAGLALQAKQRSPGIQTAYQEFLSSVSRNDKAAPWYNNLFPNLILAPTKRHWKDKSRLDDVANVLLMLSKIKDGPFAIPEMGCGLGGLKWSQVQGAYEVFKTVSDTWMVIHPEKTYKGEVHKKMNNLIGYSHAIIKFNTIESMRKTGICAKMKLCFGKEEDAIAQVYYRTTDGSKTFVWVLPTYTSLGFMDLPIFTGKMGDELLSIVGRASEVFKKHYKEDSNMKANRSWRISQDAIEEIIEATTKP
jgi:hypothetical protein